MSLPANHSDLEGLSRSIRESYDNVADEYTKRIYDELRQKPLDRALLARFAQEVGTGLVCDIGCGPGHVTKYLRGLGVNVFGLDLSPGMLKQARRLNPEIKFEEGNMLSLPFPEKKLNAIVAFYSICNLPEKFLPQAFREMHRVLKPTGVLFLAFHAGDETLHNNELWGKKISMDFFLYEPASIRILLENSGFSMVDVILREPYAPEVEHQSRRAYLFARKST
jgi:SAM-dependent methyltransferase